MSDDAKKMDEVLEEEVIEETSEVCEDAEADEEAEAQAEEKEANPEDEALNERYLRLMADFQNFKRRTEKEKGDIYAFANEKIIGELLNVIDNFERAMAS